MGMQHSDYLYLTSTTSKVLVKLSVVLLNKERSDPVTLSDLYRPTSRGRRYSPLSNTKKFWNLLDLVTQLVFLSRVSQRTRRFSPVISFTMKKMENFSQS